MILEEGSIQNGSKYEVLWNTLSNPNSKSIKNIEWLGNVSDLVRSRRGKRSTIKGKPALDTRTTLDQKSLWEIKITGMILILEGIQTQRHFKREVGPKRLY